MEMNGMLVKFPGELNSRPAPYLNGGHSSRDVFRHSDLSNIPNGLHKFDVFIVVIEDFSGFFRQRYGWAFQIIVQDGPEPFKAIPLSREAVNCTFFSVHVPPCAAGDVLTVYYYAVK